MIDAVFINGTAITMDKKRRLLTNAGVAVDKGVILFVGDSAEVQSKYRAKKTIDCENHVILPGFVDAHGHAGHTFFRFAVKETAHWMPAMTHTYKHYVSDEFWYTEGLVSALERLQCGVTTGVCVMGSQPRCDDPIFSVNNARAYLEVGVRDIVCAGPCHVPWPHNFSRWEGDKRTITSVTFEHVVKSLESVIERLNNTNDGMTFAYVAPFGIVTSINPSGATPLEQLTVLTEHDKRQAREMRRIAKEYDTRIHSDCFGGMVQLAKQDLENAVLGPTVHVQHCSHLSEEEVKILAETGTNAAAAPGSGAPVHLMLDAGMTVAATTDGAKTGGGFDMFACMREFQQAYRAYAKDYRLLPFERIFEMVTIDAAKVLGLDHMIGSLEVGKRADIITINLLNPRLTPNFNLLHSLVLSGQGSDIDNVMVNGQMKLENGIVLTVDEGKILKNAQAEAEIIIKRAKLDQFIELPLSHWGENRQASREEPFDLAWQKQDGGHY